MAIFFNWLKRNWYFLVIIFLVYLLFKRQVTSLNYSLSSRSPSYQENLAETPLASKGLSLPSAGGGAAPAPQVKDRLVIQNTYLSLLVKKVREAQTEIIKEAERLGGYMVDSQISSPEGVDSGNVSVRVPTTKLTEAMDFIRNLGVRVVSENLTGYDVTDQYVDIKARLETLNKTKAKFEEILNKTDKVTEILEVQRELINLQEQIDSLKGQEQYLEKNAQNAKITVYLASDELALPYAPAQPWKPSAIFKQAVRSLIGTLRSLGILIIWLVVFSVIWVPALIIFLLLRKKFKKPQV